MTQEQLQIFSFSPNALWAILGCEVDRAEVSDEKPWVIVRTIKDKFGRVISSHACGDAGYEFELSVARWLLFGTMQEAIEEELCSEHSL